MFQKNDEVEVVSIQENISWLCGARGKVVGKFNENLFKVQFDFGKIETRGLFSFEIKKVSEATIQNHKEDFLFMDINNNLEEDDIPPTLRSPTPNWLIY